MNYIINSEEEYKKAEARLEIMANAAPGTVEAQELKNLTKAVIDYLRYQSNTPNLHSGLDPEKTPIGK